MTTMDQNDEWLAAASVDADVFALRSDYRALLVLADGLVPGPSDAQSETLLVGAETKIRPLAASGRLEDIPELAAWREAYRAFGAKPQRTRPSVEALVRRIDGGGLPRIDRITDTYNAVSVSFLLPLGGEDVDAYRGAPRLVRSTGQEIFETSSGGSPASETPEIGEVVWTDAAGVTCRRWNWRQSTRTRISDRTTRALFILDSLGEATSPEDLEAAGEALRRALASFSPDCRFSTRLLEAR